MKDSILAAAAQISPVYMQLGPTVDKVCRTIAEAGVRGAELIVFPEVVIPGYPYWRGLYPIAQWAEWMVRYQKNSLAIPSPETEQLCEAARQARCFVAVGCSERSRLPGCETLYNTILFIDQEGRLLGKHRKLMPTHGERIVWGMGDGSDLQVFDTPLGRIGGLVCYEHHMTLLKAALASLGEEIHCALWAGYWVMDGHPGAKRRWRPGDSADLCEVAYANREYAFETQNFVVSAGNYDPAESLPEECRAWDIGSGGSAILNPAGLYLAGPSLDREEILYADLRAQDRLKTKAYIDTIGHYSRFDVVSLRFNKSKLGPLE
ncbi:MAG: carbon-nitrogen hydrolase family protein [Acidobacteria bacterium]|nr:carbon-nitrogen hydrolase family protein [Acidobacteriota bacterium]